MLDTMDAHMPLPMTVALLFCCSTLLYSKFTLADLAQPESSYLSVLMPHVTPSATETYLCAGVKLDEQKTYYITGFTPNASSLTVHHMILFGCKKPANYHEYWDCGQTQDLSGNYKKGQLCEGGSQVIYVWAKDAPQLTLPPAIGLQTGKNTKFQYLVLQMHYRDVSKFVDGVTDDSGVFLTYTETPTLRSAGIYMLTSGGSIAPNEEGHLEAACAINQDVEVHPIAFRGHTHGLGTLVSGYKVARTVGQRYNWTLLGKKNPQLPQMFYPVDDANIVIKKGDIIASRCTIYNNRSRVTEVGLTYEDAMCYYYLLYWVDGTETIHSDHCDSLGPPTWGWKDFPLDNIPQDASHL